MMSFRDRVYRNNFGCLVLFDICFRILTLTAIFFGLSRCFSWSLKWMGYSYLTTKNLTQFLEYPVTIVLIIFSVLLLSFVTLMEISSICVCLQYSYRYQSISIAEIFILGVNKLFVAMDIRTLLYSLLFMILPLLFMNIPLIVILGYKIQLVQYFFAGIYRALPFKGFWIVLFLVLFWISSFLFMIVISFFVENKSLRESFIITCNFFKKNKIKYIFGWLIWNGTIVLLLLIFYVAMIFFAALYVKYISANSASLAQVLVLNNQIQIVIMMLSIIFGVMLNTRFAHNLYVKHRTLCLEMSLLDIIFKNKRERIPQTILKKVIIVFILVVATESAFLYNLARNGSFIMESVMSEILVTAHRAGAKDAPENTIAALDKAIENMADYAEIDVRETLDGMVVLLHDDNLERTTGVNEYVWNMNLKDIRQLDAGSYYSKEYAGVKIPTLVEVLLHCKGKIKLNIEIKEGKFSAGFVEKVVNLIKNNDFENQCVVTSMNYKYLEQVKELNPDIKTGYIITAVYGSFESFKAADFLSVKYSSVSERLVEAAQAAGKTVHVWTVNSKTGLSKMKAMNVDNIITDNPVLAREVIMRKSDNSNFFELLKMFYKK